MEHVRFTIDGLEEMESQVRVRDQLEGIVGVRAVSISEGQNYVDINYDDQTSIAEIHNHLQNNGYKVLDL